MSRTTPPRKRHFVDGARIFSTPEDTESEDYVAAKICERYDVELIRFGSLCPIDFFARHKGGVTGVIEVKTRCNDSREYPTVFLSVQKWIALSLASMGMGVPAYFVVRFTDGIRWIEISDLGAMPYLIRIVYTADEGDDPEPCIEVPIGRMETLHETTISVRGEALRDSGA